MTAIAYRAGLMAADTQTAFENTKTTDCKIIRRDGYLIGVCGEVCPSNDQIEKWFFDKPSGPWDEFEKAKFELLVVTPQNTLFTLESNTLVYTLPKQLKFWAVGSGAEVCLGAMHMGATARQAVQAAIKYQANCGGSVITKRLK